MNPINIARNTAVTIALFSGIGISYAHNNPSACSPCGPKPHVTYEQRVGTAYVPRVVLEPVQVIQYIPHRTCEQRVRPCAPAYSPATCSPCGPAKHAHHDIGKHLEGIAERFHEKHPKSCRPAPAYAPACAPAYSPSTCSPKHVKKERDWHPGQHLKEISNKLHERHPKSCRPVPSLDHRCSPCAPAPLPACGPVESVHPDQIIGEPTLAPQVPQAPPAPQPVPDRSNRELTVPSRPVQSQGAQGIMPGPAE